MGISTAWQVLGLSAATFAFPIYSWLKMLKAVAAAEENKRERLLAAQRYHQQIIADALSAAGLFVQLDAPGSEPTASGTFVGVAKPATQEQIAAGAFSRGL